MPACILKDKWGTNPGNLSFEEYLALEEHADRCPYHMRMLENFNHSSRSFGRAAVPDAVLPFPATGVSFFGLLKEIAAYKIDDFSQVLARALDRRKRRQHRNCHHSDCSIGSSRALYKTLNTISVATILATCVVLVGALYLARTLEKKTDAEIVNAVPAQPEVNDHPAVDREPLTESANPAPANTAGKIVSAPTKTVKSASDPGAGRVTVEYESTTVKQPQNGELPTVKKDDHNVPPGKNENNEVKETPNQKTQSPPSVSLNSGQSGQPDSKAAGNAEVVPVNEEYQVEAGKVLVLIKIENLSQADWVSTVCVVKSGKFSMAEKTIVEAPGICKWVLDGNPKNIEVTVTHPKYRSVSKQFKGSDSLSISARISMQLR